jgi:hypothetical protein
MGACFGVGTHCDGRYYAAARLVGADSVTDGMLGWRAIMLEYMCRFMNVTGSEWL